MAKSERNDYQPRRKPLPPEKPTIELDTSNEPVIQISNISVARKNVSDILKIIGNVLDDDVLYTAEIVIREKG